MFNFNNKSIMILKLSPLSVLIQLDTASSITRALLILIFSALFLKYTKILLTSHKSLLITPPSYRIQNPCTSPLALSWTPLLTETHSDNVSRWAGHLVTSQCGVTRQVAATPHIHSPLTTRSLPAEVRPLKITHQAVIILQTIGIPS